MAVGVGRRGDHSETVLAEKVHFRPRHRLAGCDRMHEHLLAPIDVGLHQETKVGDERHAPVGGANGALRLWIPALHRHEEQPAGGQIRVEIQGRELALPRVAGVQFGDACGQNRQVVGIDPVTKPGVPDVAARLACQVVDGAWEHLLDIDLDRFHAASEDREQAISGQG